MFDAPQSWKMSETEKVVAVIRDVEVWRLANFDGCVCCRFCIRNVDIEIGCGRGGERGVWVSSPSLEYYDNETKGDDAAKLRPIAEEVQRQVEKSDGRGPLPINLHSRKSGIAA